MLSHMTLKTKFFLINMAVVATVTLMAVESNLILRNVTEDAHEVEIASQLLQNHMDGDMMHDAIRADILKATMGVKTRNAQMVEEAFAEAKEHGERFIGNLTKNMELPIPEDMKALLTSEKPSLDQYNQMAERYVSSCKEDIVNGTDHTSALLPEFEKAFGVLEDQQGTLSDKISAYMSGLKDTQISSVASSKSLMMGLAFLTVLLALATPFFSKFFLFTPLDTLIKANQSLAEGRTAIEVPFTNRHDEIGQMAATLQVFKKNAEEKERLESEQESARLRGEEEKRKAMHALADSFQNTVGSIISDVIMAAQDLQRTAKDMRGSADETSKQSTTVAAAAEQATSNVQTVAAATEELSSSVQGIQQRTAQSNSLIQQASDEAALTNEKVRSLTEAATKIGAVVELITDIASQTNLLALNATIEAARAGEAGKGFAVVASEVKNLAGQTTKATDDIIQQVKNIQGETRESAEAIARITKSITDATMSSSAIAAAVEEQGAATREIAQSVNEASEGTKVVSENILHVASVAKKTGSAAEDVLTAATELSESGELLKKQVNSFLQSIRG